MVVTTVHSGQPQKALLVRERTTVMSLMDLFEHARCLIWLTLTTQKKIPCD